MLVGGIATAGLMIYLGNSMSTPVLLLVMAVPICVFNLLGDTNFMFLMHPVPGSPLLWFEERWENHLLRDPVLLMAAAAVMSVPTRFMGQKRRRVYPG